MIETKYMNKILSSGLILLMAALLFSCEKDISKIGIDVVGENALNVVYSDTFAVKVHSELIDSLRTDELSGHVLGAYKDPVFGTLNASVYSQFRLNPENEDYNFGEGAMLDSIILFVKYVDTLIYGDAGFTQNFTVYELGDDMSRDSGYYSFDNVRVKHEILGEVSYVPSFDSIDYYKLNDTTTYTKLQPIRIPLSQEFGERLMGFDSITYSSNDNFVDAFKGIYITTLDQYLPSTGGGLVSTNFESTEETFIGLYYHNDTDTAAINFIVDFNTAHFSNFNHYEYQDADFDFRNQVIDEDFSLGESQFYLQGLAGVRAVVEFPHLGKMDDYYNYAVNEAKLFVYNNELESDYDAVSSLTLSHKVIVDSVPNYYLISDASSGENYFSGDYNSADKKYYFRITQHIQRLIKGETDDNQMRIEMIGGAVHANRLVATGWNPIGLEDKKIVLQLVYTKIDDD